ncbi:MAG: hypothetical protein JW904_03330 [Spirochaetales bacterium]|nr:hypothetical protein [Spirochaetales bacterium]
MAEKALTVQPVKTKKDLERFIEFPYTLYKKILKNQYWVPPLKISEKEIVDRRKFPFFLHAEMQEFIALKDRTVVGRIAIIIDRQYQKYREKDTAYFGFFECIPDRETAFLLFATASDYAKSRNIKKIIGPISPTTNHILGTLQNDFEGVPMIQVPYNPAYYLEFYDEYGFVKEKDHLAFIVRKGELQLSDKIKRVVSLVRRNKRIQIRNVNMNDFANEVLIAKEIYNQAWIENSDFVPWTDEEFAYLANDLKLVIVPELTFFAFVDGKPAGVSIAFNNFNEIFKTMNGRLFPFGIFKLLFGKKKIKSFRLAIMGVLEEYRWMGVDALFVLETYEHGERLGYESCEMSLILEDNHILVNMLEKWGSKPYRTYRVYAKKI